MDVETRDWGRNREMWARLLETRTGSGLDAWMRLIRRANVPDERSLRAWLAAVGVRGYAQQLLVMETFGYPDFLARDAESLIAGQYADRTALRSIYDAIVSAAAGLGKVALQARKTYVSLVGPRRTFARIVPATRTRVDLGLRMTDDTPRGRLLPSTIHETMRVRLALERVADVDAEAIALLEQAYLDNL